MQPYAFLGITRREGESAANWRQALNNNTVRGIFPDGFLPFILSTIDDEVKGLRAGTAEYRKALKRALAKLAKAIQTPGTKLNLLVTGAVSK
jgi:hypothetical protein